MWGFVCVLDIEIARLTSQSRDIPEVANLGGKRISMARVAVCFRLPRS